jgi:DedD protein
MALLKFLRRPGPSTETPTTGAAKAAAQAVQAARQQARRRLMGAVVLLGIGIIGFPLVFQTQPRPIPVDIPIDIPNREQAGALPSGPTKAPVSPEPGPSAPARVATAAPVAEATVEVEVLPAARGDALREPSQNAARDAAKDVPKSVAKDTATDTATDTAKEPAKAGAKDGQEANEAKDTDKGRGRFVVQAGSYTDLDTVREVRQKLERLGIKTYTQAAVIEGVTRVRVRVGPYSSRQEAQDVLAKIKAAGVAASLLQL